MKITVCQDKTSWDKGILQNPNPSFLQSWEWGEFQRAAGREPVRLQIVDGERVAGQAQGFAQRLGLGVKYLYVPRVWEMGNLRHGSTVPSRSPRCDVARTELRSNDGKWEMLVCYAKAAGFVFVRVEPISLVHVTGYVLCDTDNRQPRHTLVLDVSQDESALLAAMHAKTRYNINLAERKGVVVREGAEADIFWRLNQETTGRDRFRSHGREYYDKMLACPIVHQITAYADNKPIAANILVHYGDTLTYLHGASSNADRNFMAPYLLQWEGIRLAKRLGCAKYDFWGIAPQCQMSATTSFHGYTWEAAHPWTGITRFKVGFGGEPFEYGHAIDIVLRPGVYKAYQSAKRLRGILSMRKVAYLIPRPSPFG